MANLLGFFKKIEDQINPFDGGKTWSNPNPAPRPPSQDHRNLVSKVFDQVNPLDSGRSFHNPTPRVNTPVAPAIGNALHTAWTLNPINAVVHPADAYSTITHHQAPNLLRLAQKPGDFAENLAKGTVQGAARTIVGTAASLTPEKNRVHIDPNNSFNKYVFGDKSLGTLGDVIKENQIKSVGGKHLPGALSLAAGAALTAGNVAFGGGGEKQLAKSAIEGISKASTAKTVLSALEKDKNLSKLPDVIKGHFAQRVAKVTDPKIIQREAGAALDAAKQASAKVKPGAAEVPLKKLTSYEGAPDLNQVSKVMDEYKAGKPIKPIIVKKDSLGNFGIEDGKHRFEAAKQLGLKTIPVKDASKVEGLTKLTPPGVKTAISTTYDKSVANLPKAVQAKLPTVTHEVRSQRQITQAANDLVKTDYETAKATALSRRLASDTPDSHSKLVESALQESIKRGDTEGTTALWNELKAHGTTQGQGLASLNFGNKISPEGIVRYAQKNADAQGKKLSKEAFDTLRGAAKEISKMPAGEEKNQAIAKMLEAAQNKGLWEKTKDVANNILSAPRAIMASGDLSFGGRQGAVLGALHPKEWAKAQANSARYAFDSKAYDKGMAAVRELTDSKGAKLKPVFDKMKLDLEGAYGRSEEAFGTTNLIESKAAKKVGIGHVVAGSDRAFTGAATDIRSSVTKNIIDKYGGVDEVMKNWTTKDFQDLGRVLNTATGRGHGGAAFEKAAPTLSKGLFSARLWKSRLDLLNPVYYARLSPVARKEALKSSSAFASVVGATLAAATAVGADVETDPRSSDFGKIKIGNTRYDIMGGLQQNIVLAAREFTGEKKDSTTGQVTKFANSVPELLTGQHPKLKQGPYAGNRLGVLGDFVQNKENPVLSAGSRILRGKDAGNQPVNPWTEVAKLFIPLPAQDIYTTAKDSGLAKGTAKAIPGIFGIGVQTYGGDAGKPKGKPIAQGSDIQQLKDGKYYSKSLDKKFDNQNDAEKAVFVDGFKKGSDKIKEFGSSVYIKNPRTEQGYSVKNKDDYEFDKVDSKLSLEMDRNKLSGDVNSWLGNAQKKYDALEARKKTFDPETDQATIDGITLKQENLLEQAQKYQAYGGFTKAKKGRSGRGGRAKAPSLNLKTASSSKITRAKAISVRPAKFKAPKTRKLSVSKIPKLV